MMKKIAYIAHISQNRAGVYKKIQDQITAWRAAGHIVTSFFIEREGELPEGVYRGWKKYDLLNPHFRLLHSLRKFAPDIIYSREMLFSPLLTQLLLLFSNKIVLEINSDSLSEFRHMSSRSFKDRRAYWIYKSTAPLILKFCLGLVCVTEEIMNLPLYAGMRNKIYSPNGIKLDDYPIAKTASAEGRVNILFSGSPDQPWHGIDKIIKLAAILGNNYHFHLCGPDIDQKDLLENISTYGYVPINEIMGIASKCDFGFGTAAFHRNNLQEGCPLKVREYLAYGLPVLLPYKDTAFLKSVPDWVCELPNTEEGLFEEEAILKIINFVKMHQSTVVTHDMCSEFIDSRPLEKQKIEIIAGWLA